MRGAIREVLEVMKIAKRYLQKGETIYETKTYAGGGHQARVELPHVHFPTG